MNLARHSPDSRAPKIAVDLVRRSFNVRAPTSSNLTKSRMMETSLFSDPNGSALFLAIDLAYLVSSLQLSNTIGLVQGVPTITD